jgi:hypothetical protein
MLAALGATVMATQSPSQTSGDFYYFDGAPVPLVRSEREVVVRFANRSNGLNQLTRQAPGLQRSLEAGAPGRRFDVLSLPAVTLPQAAAPQAVDRLAEVTQLLQTLRQDPNVVFVAPVYHYGRGGIRVLPTDEIIVRLKPGDTELGLANAIDGMGLTIDRALVGTIDRFVLRMTDGKGPTALDISRALYETGRFEWAEPNFIEQYRNFDVPNDPRYSNQWHLKNTGQNGGVVGADAKLEQAWDIEDGNGSIVIAVLDDGVQKTHEDLAAAIFVNPLEIAGNGVDDDSNGKIDDVSGWDFKNNDNNADPAGDDAHGTGAAGVAAARGNNGIGVTGACRQCRILPVKVSQNGTFTDNATVANALTYAAQFADIINNSWGDGSPAAVLQTAVAGANTTGRGGKGTLSFFSSGNFASGSPTNPIELVMSAGTYGFRFLYTKNGSGAAGDDTSWLSWVTFPGVGGFTFTNGIPAGWTTGGNQPWSVVTDPLHSDESLCLTKAAKAGTVGSNQSSYLQVYKTISAGNVVIQQWTSSEANADGLKVQIDYFNNGTFFDSGYFASGIPGDNVASYTNHAVYPGVLYPAAYPEAIAVGASTNFDCRSFYSQYGPQLAFLAPSDGSYYNTGIETTDLMGSAGADTTNYYEAGQQLQGFGGTSSASPFAAGIAGLILSRSPGLTRAKVIDILKNSADKVGPEAYVSGRNDRYGHGRLNAYQALLNTPVVPGAPTNVVATPGNAQASVTFNAPASNGGSTITSYTVTSLPGGFTSTGASSPRVVTGLTNGVSYTFTVRATNEAGQGPASSASNSVMPTAGGAAPGAFSKTAPANGSASQPLTMILVWGASSGATSYEYCIDTSNNNACNTSWVSTGTSTSAALPGLLSNTAYYWHVRASNAGGTTYSDASTTAFRGFTTRRSPLSDLNGDGSGDIFTYNFNTGAWTRQISQPGGGFVQQSSGSWDPGWLITPAHFNADALTDFFLYNASSGQWFKMLNDGTGFTTQATGGWWNGWERYVLDLDGDGISDFFLYDPATGTWFKSVSTPTGFNYSQGGWNPGWELYSMTLNNDALGDLFLINRTTGRWFWALGAAGSGFTYPVTDVWFSGWQFYPGDFNGDGRGDILLHDSSTGIYFVATNTGSGFSYVQGGWSLGWKPYVADFNADGKEDLFLHAAANGVWFEMLSNGSGGFSNAGGQIWSLGWGLSPTDLNNDGRADMVLYDPASGVWYQARNLVNGTFSYNNGTWSTGLTIVARAPIR